MSQTTTTAAGPALEPQIGIPANVLHDLLSPTWAASSDIGLLNYMQLSWQITDSRTTHLEMTATDRYRVVFGDVDLGIVDAAAIPGSILIPLADVKQLRAAIKHMGTQDKFWRTSEVRVYTSEGTGVAELANGTVLMWDLPRSKFPDLATWKNPVNHADFGFIVNPRYLADVARLPFKPGKTPPPLHVDLCGDRRPVRFTLAGPHDIAWIYVLMTVLEPK